MTSRLHSRTQASAARATVKERKDGDGRCVIFVFLDARRRLFTLTLRPRTVYACRLERLRDVSRSAEAGTRRFVVGLELDGPLSDVLCIGSQKNLNPGQDTADTKAHTKAHTSARPTNQPEPTATRTRSQPHSRLCSECPGRVFRVSVPVSVSECQCVTRCPLVCLFYPCEFVRVRLFLW